MFAELYRSTEDGSKEKELIEITLQDIHDDILAVSTSTSVEAKQAYNRIQMFLQHAGDNEWSRVSADDEARQ